MADAILVTGGLGFIGGHVVERLARDAPDARIVVLDKQTYAALPETVAAVERALAAHGNGEIYRGDICDEATCNFVLGRERVRVVLHLAAESHVDRSLGSSVAFTRTNVVGTHVLLEACRTRLPAGQLQAFIHVSTDEVHGSVEDPAVPHEGLPLAPTNPYAASKAAAEMQVLSYAKSFGMPCLITRGNNVYGPRQHPEKLVAACMTRLRGGDPLCIHGAGTQLRSWVYVEDVARMFSVIVRRAGDLLRTVAEGAVPVLFVGSSDERSVADVVHDCARLEGLDDAVAICYDEDPRPFNDVRYVSGLDPRVRRLLDAEAPDGGPFAPVTWSEGLARTAEAFGVVVKDESHSS